MCHHKQRYLIYLRHNKTDMKQISIPTLLFFSIVIYSPIFAYGCSFAGPVDNFVSVFDMNGEKIVDRKLERFSVGADCSIQNKVLVGEGDTVYIENEYDILTHVDFSTGRWKELDDYPMGDYNLRDVSDYNYEPYSNFLSIFEEKIVIGQQSGYDDWQVNTSMKEYSVLLRDFQNHKQEILRMDIETELLKLGSNYTIAYDHILTTSSANWISLLTFVNVENKDNINTYFWTYRYDMNTGDSISFSILKNETIEYFDYGPVFHISAEGDKGYFINGHPYDSIFLFNYNEQKIEILEPEYRLHPSGIKNGKIYGVSIAKEGGLYSLKVLDLTTMQFSSAFDFLDGYPSRFYILDTVLLGLETRIGSDSILSINLFPLLGISFAVLVVFRRKLFYT